MTFLSGAVYVWKYNSDTSTDTWKMVIYLNDTNILKLNVSI